MDTSINQYQQTVRLKDIARACGVGISTVSRAIRNDPRILPETKARILATAQALGYNPSAQAAAHRLTMQRLGRPHINQLVALSIPRYFQVPLFMNLFQGAASVLTEAGNGVLAHVLAGPEASDVPPMLPPAFVKGDVDGLLYTGIHDFFIKVVEELRHTPGFGAHPVVCLLGIPPAGCSAVKTDDGGGAYAAVQHLLTLGHRHMLQLTLSHEDARLAERQASARQAYRDHGLDPALYWHEVEMPPQWVVSPPHAEIPLWGGDQPWSLLDTLQRYPETTAILGVNDASAIRAWYALNAAGYRVPDDISIIGFDDTDPYVSDRGENLLTSIQIPMREIGERGAELLLAQLHDPALSREQVIIVPSSLVVRASTAPPRLTRR